jgi:peptidylprolyl isomerase
MRFFITAVCALCVGACAARHPALPPSPIPVVKGTPVDRLALRSIDYVVGKGALFAPSKCLYVHYTGWLTNGTKFDSSRDTLPNGTMGDPIAFPQGVRRVIVGWDMGFEGMRVGGKRRLLIPYPLAYGDGGRPPIPPRSDLIFDVQLMAIADTLARNDAAPRGQPGVPQCPAWATVKPTLQAR